MLSALAGGDGRALTRQAKLTAQAAIGARTPEEELDYWLGGHLEINAVARNRRWTILQEKRASQSAHEADEQSVEHLDASVRPPMAGGPSRIVLRKPGRWRHLSISPSRRGSRRPAGGDDPRGGGRRRAPHLPERAQLWARGRSTSRACGCAARTT